MPSFTSIAALAIGLLSASSLAQSNLGSVEADLVARDDLSSDNLFARGSLEKRRANHANEYGYPHNRGPHSGTGKMTPGGYSDPKPSNLGSKCWYNNQCHSHVHLGAAFCNAHGRCDFYCLGDTWRKGDKCVGSFEAPTCKHHHHCETHIAHADPFCDSGKCSFQCKPGYHAKGNYCVPNAENLVCGHKKCPEVENGFSTCAKNWKGQEVCEQHCDKYLGYKLYTNKHKTAYKCIDIKNDKNNCGKPGHVCPMGYHNKGDPFCYDYQCGLDCHGYQTRYTKSGVPYCSKYKL